MNDPAQAVILPCSVCKATNPVSGADRHWRCRCGAEFEIVDCPKCRRPSQCPVKIRGKQLVCPHCKAKFKHPQPATAAAMAVEFRRRGLQFDAPRDPDARYLRDLILMSSGGSAIPRGSTCTVACLADGITIFSGEGLEEQWPYARVHQIELSGPDPSVRDSAMVEWFGVAGSLASAALKRKTTRTDFNTVIRLVTASGEYVFLSHLYGGDAFKASLAPVFTRIRVAQSAHAASAPGGLADEIAKLAQLHESGVLSDDEFKDAKESVLRRGS